MSEYVRVAAGTPLSDEERAQLRALAQMPDCEIDFSDIPERIYDPTPTQALPLSAHTVTLRVDSEVAEWLGKAAQQDASRINAILKREARRTKQITSVSAEHLYKAS